MMASRIVIVLAFILGISGTCVNYASSYIIALDITQ